jgi:tRNA-2-methylthio-N6-dimethylallyladenosine synthase
MPAYAITTFGCQMNVHDSDRIHEVLRGAGYTEARPGEADVILLNTCSVREKADQKLRSEVGRLARLKRDRPDLVLVVAGCVAQQAGEALLKKMPAVDLVVGPDNIPEIPRLLDDIALGAPPLAMTAFDLATPRFLTAPSLAASSKTAYVTVMKGCDERCSFCIVPYTRGPERYRPSDDVVSEITALVASGAREITLLGQTVNSYHDPSRPARSEESDFPALLRRIAAEAPSLARLRYTSPHPRHLTERLIDAHAELAVLARHVHLPVQSGSDRVLRRMIRRYTRAEYLASTQALARRVPGITLSTDIIVGFPGESEADFLETLSLVEAVGFSSLFGFKYSERPHTPSRRLTDDVPEATKRERLWRLFELSDALAGAHLSRLVGSTQQVLVEGVDKDNAATWSGRTERNEIVHLEGAGHLDLWGVVVEVNVLRANRHSLIAELTPSTRSRHAPRAPGAPGGGPKGLGGSAPPAARRSLPLVAGEL